MRIDQELKVDNKIEVHAEQKQEYKFIGSMKLRRGHKIFSYNYKTDEIKEVEIIRQKVCDEKGQPILNGRVKYDPGLIYITSLNHQNAKRKILKHREAILASVNV